MGEPAVKMTKKQIEEASEKAFGDPTKKVGVLIDAAFKARARRKLLEARVDELKRAEIAAKVAAIEALRGAKLDSARGKGGQATIVFRDLATVEDWPALYAHIKRTGNFELLHRRVALGACVERWDQNVEVPGVKRERELDLKLSEAKR